MCFPFLFPTQAEDWFKEGTKLLVEVAGETVSIKNPEQAERLRSRIEHFLKPGEEAQQERITHISTLANELYGDTVPKPVCREIHVSGVEVSGDS